MQRKSDDQTHRSIARLLILTGLTNWVLPAAILVLVVLPRLITFDVLYFSSWCNFSLGTSGPWRWLGMCGLILCCASVVVGAVIRRKGDNQYIQKLAFMCAILHTPLLPFGPVFGPLLIGKLRSNPGESDPQPSVADARDVGETMALIGGIHCLFVGWLYWVTSYFSFVMLDATWPTLTITVIWRIRTVLFIFLAIGLGQVGTGIALRNNGSLARKIAKFYGIAQVLLPPVGTYYGVHLLRFLRASENNR